MGRLSGAAKNCDGAGASAEEVARSPQVNRVACSRIAAQRMLGGFAAGAKGMCCADAR